MSFKQKLSGFKNKMTDKMATSNLGLAKLIKEIKDFGKNIERFSLENLKYIEYLKNAEEFDKNTVPFSENLENIDVSRKELIENLNTECVVPLEELINDWLQLQEMKKEVDKNIKDHEKDKRNLEKAKAKLEKLNSAEERIEEKIAEQEETVDENAKVTGESFDLVKSKEAGLDKVDKKYKTKESKILKKVFTSQQGLLAKFYTSAAEILSVL